MAVKETISAVEIFAGGPGFHVMQGKDFLGTYDTAEDAQCFIDGHVIPAGLTANIVEGSAE